MPQEPSSALRVRGLSKAYGGKRVVDDLDLDLEPGKVLGLLGPNGAGKTTTLRMLYGYVEPDAGTIEYGGKRFDAHRTEVKRWIGVCTQEDTADGDFDVERNLQFYATYFRPRVEDVNARVEELIERFGLDPFRRFKPIMLSGGYRRRLMIARSIVHRPKVLFLDEPTTGLDPKARVDLWKLIRELREEGMAIVLTTHYMDEAERLSDELVVMAQGKAVASGAPSEILDAVVGEHILIVEPFDGQADVRAWATTCGLADPSEVLDELHYAVDGTQLAAFSERFPDSRFTVRKPNLDDLFLKLAIENEGSP